MDHSYSYIASLIREPFLFYEMRSTAKLMSEGLSDSTVTATTHIGVNANELERLIAAVRTKMDTLTDTDKETASESLEVIEAEIVSEKPKNP